MQVITLKLKQKNDFKYQIKNGAKVLNDIVKVSDGWHSACRLHETLDLAVEYARNSLEEAYCAFGKEIKVVIS